jgi:hypothetical protein
MVVWKDNVLPLTGLFAIVSVFQVQTVSIATKGMPTGVHRQLAPFEQAKRNQHSDTVRPQSELHPTRYHHRSLL